MYSFGYSSLPIAAPTFLSVDDVILMLVLLNTSTAFDSFSGLTMNIFLFGLESIHTLGNTQEGFSP